MSTLSETPSLAAAEDAPAAEEKIEKAAKKAKKVQPAVEVEPSEEKAEAPKKAKKMQAVAAEPAEEAEKVPAPKKAKKVQPVAAPVDDVASVGDANLARNGKPIVKKLYKEHKEVTAMTQEKVCGGRATCWREGGGGGHITGCLVRARGERCPVCEASPLNP